MLIRRHTSPPAPSGRDFLGAYLSGGCAAINPAAYPRLTAHRTFGPNDNNRQTRDNNNCDDNNNEDTECDCPVPYTCEWKVLEITSSCCSRLSLWKFTAYPETRIVKLGYFSGFAIASTSNSRSTTLIFT